MTSTTRRVLIPAVLLVGGLTALSRLVGFLRVQVLGQTLGTTCLGTAYTSANTVPNIVFELVVGGALAGVVVPLLAGPVARGDLDRVRGTISALTGWVLCLLIPAGVLTALLAGPAMHLLLGASGQCAGAVVHTTATHLLIVFALQIPIYGLAVVALGALQAAHRFVGMTLAPLVSSLVLIAAYLVYGWSSGTDAGSISTLDSGQFWVLAGGTTLAVAALLVTLLPSLLRAGYVTRLSLHFPSGIGARARALAAAGVVTVSAQWLAYAFVLRLVNSYGTPGDAVVFLVAWTVFLLPWAVLAFPIAIVSFPSLAALHDADDRTGFATLAALSTRRILLAAGLGAAALVALGPPVADFLLLGAPGPDHTDELSGALAALAPAVVGYALLAHLSRVLYARHRGRMSSSLAVLAWVVVVGVGVVVAPEVGAGNVVVVVAVAVSTGTVVGAAASLLALSLASPAGSLRGIGRAAAATVVGCSLAAVAGRLVVDQFTIGSPLAALLVAAIGGVVVVAIYLGLLRLIDAEDLTGMLRLRRNADSAPQPDPPLG